MTTHAPMSDGVHCSCGLQFRDAAMAQEHANRANKRDPRNAVMDVKPGSFEDLAARYPGHINLVDDDAAWQRDHPHVHCGLAGHTDPGEDEHAAPCYTRDQIEAAVNGGADMIGMSDRINLIVNAQLTLLTKPDATLEDVILANWQADEEDYAAAGIDTESDDHDLTEDEERAVDAALVERVKGWLK